MNIEKMREEARRLCQERGVKVLPYASGWWLVGYGISRVVGELAGLKPSHLIPLPVTER